jgi:preprotein translocase subunit Sec63
MNKSQFGIVLFCALIGYLVVSFLFDLKKSKRVPHPSAPPPSNSPANNQLIWARQLFGLDSQASSVQVSARYHELISQYHPDKTQHLGTELQQLAERKTREIIEAYNILQRHTPPV